MGMVSSEEYVRTSRQVIYKIQKAVNKSLVDGSGGPFHEDESINRLCKFAAATGANPNRAKKRHSVLVYGLNEGSPCLGGLFPTLQVLPDDWDEAEDRGRKGSLGLPEDCEVLRDHLSEDCDAQTPRVKLLCSAWSLLRGCLHG